MIVRCQLEGMVVVRYQPEVERGSRMLADPTAEEKRGMVEPTPCPRNNQ